MSNRAWFTLTTAVLVNLPLVAVLYFHFPHYLEYRTFQMLGHLPGQFLFLIIFFPFIAYSVHYAVQSVREVCAETDEIRSSSIFRLFLEKKYRIPTLGLALGILASILNLGVPADIDGLLPRNAKMAVVASDIIIEAIQHSDSKTVVDKLKASSDRNGYRNQISLDFLTLNNLTVIKESEEGKNKQIVENIGKTVFRQLPEAPTELEELLNSLELHNYDPSKHQPLEYLFDSIVYMQIVLNPEWNDPWRIPYDIIVITNFVELATNVFVGFHILCLAAILAAIRMRKFMDDSNSPRIRVAASHLAYATVLLGFWPPLRLYTTNELNLVYHQAASDTGPIAVGVTLFLILLFLILTFVRSDRVNLIALLGALAVNIGTFALSLTNIFILRDVIGSGASIANVGFVMIMLFLAIGFISWILSQAKRIEVPARR